MSEGGPLLHRQQGHEQMMTHKKQNSRLNYRSSSILRDGSVVKKKQVGQGDGIQRTTGVQENRRGRAGGRITPPVDVIVTSRGACPTGTIGSCLR